MSEGSAEDEEEVEDQGTKEGGEDAAAADDDGGDDGDGNEDVLDADTLTEPDDDPTSLIDPYLAEGMGLLSNSPEPPSAFVLQTVAYELDAGNEKPMPATFPSASYDPEEELRKLEKLSPIASHVHPKPQNQILTPDPNS